MAQQIEAMTGAPDVAQELAAFVGGEVVSHSGSDSFKVEANSVMSNPAIAAARSAGYQIHCVEPSNDGGVVVEFKN
jgi:hypothetical protein